MDIDGALEARQYEQEMEHYMQQEQEDYIGERVEELLTEIRKLEMALLPLEEELEGLLRGQ